MSRSPTDRDADTDEYAIADSAAAARQAHEWVVGSGLYGRVIEHAGAYDSKLVTAENASLASHLLNAATVAVNTFVYEAFQPGDDIQEYADVIRVLACAAVLHDMNKVVYWLSNPADDRDSGGNTREAFDRYADPDGLGDPFGVDKFLPDGGLDEFADDLLYLIQRTEIREDSTETRGSIRPELRGLERYTRLGDQVASIAQANGIGGVYRRLSEEFSDAAHLLTFAELEQPVLNELLIGSVKEVIAGDDQAPARGVMIGSTPNAVVYLGEPIDRADLKDRVADCVGERILTEFEFSCKFSWQTFGYESLSDLDIDPETKERIIVDAVRDEIEGDDETAGREEFERIPGEFEQYVPVLTKALYLDGRREWDGFGPTSVGETIQREFDEIYDEVGGHKIKFYFLTHLVDRYLDPDRREETAAFLDHVRKEIRPKLHDDLEPDTDTDVAALLADRFFRDSFATGTDINPPASAETTCFVCGEHAETLYKKDDKAVYQAYGFSRRLPPNAEYKRICEICDLEHALFEDICSRNDVSVTSDIEVAYFYFDEFLADVRVQSRRIGSVIQGDTVDIDDPAVSTSLVAPQYFMQPFYVLGENHRMHVIRRIMETAQRTGMKVVIGRPFAHPTRVDAVFTDQETGRAQEVLGLDEAERFGPLPEFAHDLDRDVHDVPTDPTHLRRATHLFKILGIIREKTDLPNPYFELDRDEFHVLTDLVIRKLLSSRDRDMASQPIELSDTIHDYIETYHSDSFMKMRQVAERGEALFGKQYDSKYKKTKIMRETIDALLAGMSRGMSGEILIEHVAGQVHDAADREEYGFASDENVEAFVDAVWQYLVENDLDDLTTLSDWRNPVINTYYYTYEKVIYE